MVRSLFKFIHDHMIKSLKTSEICVIFGAKYKCFCRNKYGVYTRISIREEYTKIHLLAFHECLRICCDSVSELVYISDYSSGCSSPSSRSSSVGNFYSRTGSGYVVDDMRDEPGFIDKKDYFLCGEDSDLW